MVRDTGSGVAICRTTTSSGCDLRLELDASFGLVWSNIPGYSITGSTLNNDPKAVAGGNAAVSVVLSLVCKLGTLNSASASYPILAQVLCAPKRIGNSVASDQGWHQFGASKSH